MLHPLEHVRDHQTPLADTPALAPCQAPQLGRPRFAAKEVCRHPPSPQMVRLSINSTTSGGHRKPVLYPHAGAISTPRCADKNEFATAQSTNLLMRQESFVRDLASRALESQQWRPQHQKAR